MPNYDYQCEACESCWEQVFTIAERDVPITKPCPICLAVGQVVKLWAAPFIGDPVRQGITKTDNGWKETLSRIKAHHPRSTIDPDRY